MSVNMTCRKNVVRADLGRYPMKNKNKEHEKKNVTNTIKIPTERVYARSHIYHFHSAATVVYGNYAVAGGV